MIYLFSALVSANVFLSDASLCLPGTIYSPNEQKFHIPNAFYWEQLKLFFLSNDNISDVGFEKG